MNQKCVFKLFVGQNICAFKLFILLAKDAMFQRLLACVLLDFCVNFYLFNLQKLNVIFFVLFKIVKNCVALSLFEFVKNEIPIIPRSMSSFRLQRPMFTCFELFVVYERLNW